MANTFKFGNGQWATKEGSTLAYNSENGNFKPLPFDFTRATSATRVNKQGLIETVASGVPRIDFLNDSKGALLLEPQRTNIITESAVFSGYGGNNEVITDNATTSPDGTLTGAILADDNAGGTGTVQIFKVVAVDVSSTYTYSVFAKKKDLNFISLRLSNFTTPVNDNSYFNLNLGTVVSAGSGSVAEIENYGNGWYRCSVTFTTDVADTNGTLHIRLSENGTDTTVDLDNTSNIYIWGWQFEKSNHASSYIPTSGSAVTVVAETCNQTPPSGIIGQTEGTVVINTTNFLSSGNRTFALFYTSGASYYQIYLTALNEVRVDVNGVFLFLGSTLVSGTQSKIAFAYKSGDFALYIDGVQVAISASATIPASLNDFYLGNSLGGEQIGGIDSFLLYDTRLPNAELQQLTS
jgi:hypothetical protein